jgi:hypothetical protein
MESFTGAPGVGNAEWPTTLLLSAIWRHQRSRCRRQDVITPVGGALPYSGSVAPRTRAAEARPRTGHGREPRCVRRPYKARIVPDNPFAFPPSVMPAVACHVLRGRPKTAGQDVLVTLVAPTHPVLATLVRPCTSATTKSTRACGRIHYFEECSFASASKA